MATTRSDEQVVKVFVSFAELAALLGNQAQAAGFINFAPDSVDLHPTEEADRTDPNNVVMVPGWEVVFVRNLP